MTRRRQRVPEPRQARLTDGEMRAAIPRLRARIEELRAVNVDEIQRNHDPALDALESKIAGTLADILGADTVDYKRFEGIYLNLGIDYFGGGSPINEVRESYASGIAQMIAQLGTQVDLFEEKLGGVPADPVSRARRAFGDLDLHPEVARAATGLFESGPYTNAVEDACKVLDGLVKIRSGSDRSGTELMQSVFSPDNPVLKFNDLKTETDKSEQQGMMFLYAGTMLALRNPRAHELVEDDPEMALEYIAFVSMLAKALDRATRA